MRFTAVNRTSLRSLAHGPRTLTLTYVSAAEPELRELVRLERECCAFLAFHLTPIEDDVVVLRIGAPALEGAEHLLDPFLGGTDAMACRANDRSPESRAPRL